MIPFLDLKAQYAAIGGDVETAILNVLRSGDFVLGPAVSAFETAFAEACGAATRSPSAAAPRPCTSPSSPSTSARATR